MPGVGAGRGQGSSSTFKASVEGPQTVGLVFWGQVLGWGSSLLPSQLCDLGWLLLTLSLSFPICPGLSPTPTHEAAVIRHHCLPSLNRHVTGIILFNSHIPSWEAEP